MRQAVHHKSAAAVAALRIFFLFPFPRTNNNSCIVQGSKARTQLLG
jgi:hypothetical protein